MSRSDKEKILSLILNTMLALGVVYILAQTAWKNNNRLQYKVILGVWLVAYVFINDIVEPYLTGKIINMKEYKKETYLMYALLDIVSFAGIYLFVINAHEVSEPLHYFGAIVFGVLLIPKKKAYFRFLEMNKDTDEEPEDTESIQTELTADSSQEAASTVQDDDFEIDTLSLDKDDNDIKEIVFRDRRKK